jgi:hypothetical protein
MNFTRIASRGRPLVAGLALGALLLGGPLLGGCARHAGSSADRPAPVTGPAPGTASDDTAAGSDVNDLLDEVDRQLDADDQPLEDQD